MFNKLKLFLVTWYDFWPANGLGPVPTTPGPDCLCHIIDKWLPKWTRN